MKKELKQRKKALNKNYSDFMYEVIGYIRQKNLSKYAYIKLRDEAIEMIADAQDEGVSKEIIFKKGYKEYIDKKSRKLPEKNVIEKICGLVFAFFTLFFALSLFMYIYRFPVGIEGFKSEGIYLNVNATNLAMMFVYGFLGALLSIVLQKIDRKSKMIMGTTTLSIGAIICITFFIIGYNYSYPLKINMIVVFVVCIALALGGFFLEDYLSKKINVGKQEKTSE